MRGAICAAAGLLWFVLATVANAQTPSDGDVDSASASTPTATASTDAGTGSRIFRSHAITLYDAPPKYGPDFRHFEYVNPDAPKGGRLVTGAQGTFNSFHAYISKGDPAATLSVQTLLTQSRDEPFTNYGLVASEIEWPEDRSWVIFHVDPEARWHDGKPITADDVIWSYETLISKGPPGYQYYFGSVKTAEKLTENSVKFSFAESNNRELPMILGDLPVLPKHYWESRDFEKITLDPPLGSGPYRVREFDAGRSVTYERVKDYWAADHPTQLGQHNFDELVTLYYLDAGSMRIAIKAGDLDFRLENQAKAWAVDYDVSSVEKGLLRKEVFATNTTQGMVGLVFNLRRKMFQDIRVRKALILAYDFEWTNRNMFFSQYTRFESYFDNSVMKAKGPVNGEELAILEPLRDQLTPEVFDAPQPNPVTDAGGWPRENLLEASRLLEEAGFVVKDLKRIDPNTGKQFVFEIMNDQSGFERLFLPYIRNLKRLGIDASVRTIDTSQYVERRRDFDFDTFYSGWPQSSSPGNEQRGMWGSDAASKPSSRNFIGIQDPAVDALIEKLIQSDNRETLSAHARALDRVLRAGHYVIPGWYLAADRVLFWDKYGYPPATRYGALTSSWWQDADKARALQAVSTAGEMHAPEESGESSRPGAATVFALIAGLLLVLWLLMRTATRKKSIRTDQQ